jgi:putative SOS response-associated peptidase YedK
MLIQHFGLHGELQLPLRYNVAPTQQVPVIRQTDSGRELSMMRWGLVPSWADDPKIGYKLINARSEEAAAKPSFRSAMEKRRCLIPADGYYDPDHSGSQVD